MGTQDIIKELKIAKIAYELSREWDYCPSRGDDAFIDIEGLERYSGCRPDEIAHDIIRLIDKL